MIRRFNCDLRQNKLSTIFVEDVDSVATASVSKCNPGGILFIQTSWSFSSQILGKLFFSWQCNPRVHLGHRPLNALCFEGPTTTCVQRANRRRLCWKIHHTGEAVGQLTQLITAQIYYKKMLSFQPISVKNHPSDRVSLCYFWFKNPPSTRGGGWWENYKCALLSMKK